MAINPKWIVNLKGREYPLWAGILAAATEAGLKSLRTKVIQVPCPENGNLAVVMATAVFDDERVFEDVGDCSPQSTSPHLAPASLRMASTRAKGRCLRDALNIGQTMFEELPDGMAGEPDAKASDRRDDTTANITSAGASGSVDSNQFCASCGLKLTSAQATLSQKRFDGISLCPNCQKGSRTGG